MAVFHPALPEQWYQVPGFPLYEISSQLRLRSHHIGVGRRKRSPHGRLIKFHTDDRGYKKLVLWRDGKYHNLYLHRVVAELSFGSIPSHLVVRHLDDDKSNNWPGNLAIGTHRENLADSMRNGHFRVARGEECGNAFLNERIVRAIRLLREYGLPVSLIAECFDLTISHTGSILSGERWKHSSGAV